MSSNIGPQLPPHLRHITQTDSGNDDDDEDVKSRTSVGPQLPAHLCKNVGSQSVKKVVAGPQLPPHLQQQQSSDDEEEDETPSSASSSSYGPSLPPGYTQGCEKKQSIGPALPSSLQHGDEESGDESDDDVIGPALPPGPSQKPNSVAADFEARANAMKNKLTGKSDDDTTLKRETWMTELPPEFSKNFGMGPRTFRTKAQDLGDRSVWTDTPADRERKRQEAAKEAKKSSSEPPAKKKAKVPTAEELEMHASVEEYNQSKRPQSLLEMHRSKTEGTKNDVRKPFDRSRDLSMHRKDPKQVEQYIKGAKNMTEKFSAGTYENKFL